MGVINCTIKVVSNPKDIISLSLKNFHPADLTSLLKMSLRRAKSAREFYSTQTVFLTGSTGGLGGCLLYMLALVLRTPKIYVLVRGSDKRAVDRWRQTMPEQWWDLVTFGSI